MKFTVVLLLSVLVTVSVGMIARNSKGNINSNLVSPLVAGSSTTADSENFSNDNSIFEWQTFTNNYFGYTIKHPSSVQIKNNKDGNVSLQKQSSINISISQDVLNENETVNTTIESLINDKKNSQNDNFVLINNISPIYLGSVTAQTFTTRENGNDFTYYFLPQNDRKYLIIINSSPRNSSYDFLTSEDIIYSLELLP